MKKSFEDAVEDLETVNTKKDILKQKEAARLFSVSVNTLKTWVKQGCPEIRLESGMPLYSISSIHKWLLSKQK